MNSTEVEEEEDSEDEADVTKKEDKVEDADETIPAKVAKIESEPMTSQSSLEVEPQTKTEVDALKDASTESDTIINETTSDASANDVTASSIDEKRVKGPAELPPVEFVRTDSMEDPEQQKDAKSSKKKSRQV